MIVFLDVKLQKVLLYTDDGVKKIPFYNISLLNGMPENQEVLYVTNAVKTTLSEVSNLVKNIPVTKNIESVEKKAYPSDEPLFVRYVGNKGKGKNGKVLEGGGSLYIQDIDETFTDPRDFKPLDQLIRKGFKKSIISQNLLKSGKIEIISRSQIQDIMNKWQKSSNKDHELKTQELDNILVPMDSSATDYVKKVKSGETGTSIIDSDPIEIDLDKNIGMGRSNNSNENSLIPEDL